MRVCVCVHVCVGVREPADYGSFLASLFSRLSQISVFTSFNAMTLNRKQNMVQETKLGINIAHFQYKGTVDLPKG